MKKTMKVGLAAMFAVGLTLAASAAYATSDYLAWNTNLPGAQQGINVANQTKTTASAAGNIHVTYVALDYQVNAHQCRVDNAQPLIMTCGTERFGLGDNADATLPSGSYVAAGRTAFLELHNTTWTVVRVSTHGVWRAN